MGSPMVPVIHKGLMKVIRVEEEENREQGQSYKEEDAEGLGLLRAV